MGSYKDRQDIRNEKNKLQTVSYDFTDKCRQVLSRKASEGVRGWDDPEKLSDDELVKKLQAAVDDKDAIAVANYAMFLYYRKAELNEDELAMGVNTDDAFGGW